MEQRDLFQEENHGAKSPRLGDTLNVWDERQEIYKTQWFSLRINFTAVYWLGLYSLRLFHFCVCLVAQLYTTLCNPMDCSLPHSSVHGIFQASLLEQVAISYSKGSFWPRDQTHVSCPHLLRVLSFSFWHFCFSDSQAAGFWSAKAPCGCPLWSYLHIFLPFPSSSLFCAVTDRI